MSLPSLDTFFQKKDTGRLKENFIFVVDNGQSEKPSSPIIKMCLKRLVSFLYLNSTTEVSFAEYYSKKTSAREFMLRRTKVYKSKVFYLGSLNCPPAGTEERRSKMEQLRKEVFNTIKQATFGGFPILTLNGISDEDFIFSDEETLKKFLSLSEERKLVSEETYIVVWFHIVETLAMMYGVDINFEASYFKGYQAITEDNRSGRATTWSDK